MKAPLYIPKNWNGVLIVGERPYPDDLKTGKIGPRPFKSSYGVELSECVKSKGHKLEECALVYAYKEIPPRKKNKAPSLDHCFLTKKEGESTDTSSLYYGQYITGKFKEYITELLNDIDKIKPRVIIAMGKGALYALTGETKIDGFRGSMLYHTTENNDRIGLVPTHSMDRMFKQYHLRWLILHDLKRAFSYTSEGWNLEPEKFIIRPTYQQAIETLEELQERANNGEHIAMDIETRLHRFISCIGFAWSKSDAICIPLIRGGDAGFYWTIDEEVEIVSRIKSLLENKNVRISGQNYHYDAQYIAFHWGVRSHIWLDTMIVQHCFFAQDMPKDLNTISSIYNDKHVYWKDEGKNHEPTLEGEEEYWIYNCKDCCRTWEAAEVMVKAIPSFEQEYPVRFQMRMWQHLLIVMCRGVRYDKENRDKQKSKVAKQRRELACFMESLVPPSVWPRQKTPFYNSPKQLATLFYQVLGIKPVTKRQPNGTWAPTTKDEALNILKIREPLIKPLCEALSSYRSLGVSLNTFLTPDPDITDERMRSGYKLAGTATYRLASAGDVFDYGLNLQNLSKGDE